MMWLRLCIFAPSHSVSLALPLSRGQQYFGGVMCVPAELSRPFASHCLPSLLRSWSSARSPYTHILHFFAIHSRARLAASNSFYFIPVVHFYMFIYGIVGSFISSLLFYSIFSAFVVASLRFCFSFSTFSSSSSNLHCLVVLVDLIRFEFVSFCVLGLPIGIRMHTREK